MNRGILQTIHRLGEEVSIKTRDSQTDNAFNNPESMWTQERTAQCVRTYPNRNTQIESGGGSYNRDRALFIFEASESPNAGVRIEYNETEYELKSPTRYETHVAFFGEPVSN